MSKDDVSLDDELLQVTEKKSTKPPKKSKKEKSPEEEDEEDDEEEGDDREDQEEEELYASNGEDSDHKNNNKRKPKSEPKKPLKKRKTGDSDGESSDGAFDDGWDEDLMGDDKDREMLAAMPEFEREAILDERYSKRKELREGWEVERRLKAEQRANREKEKKESRRESSKRESNKETKDREKRDRVVKKSDPKGKALSELKKKRAKAGYKKSGSNQEEPEEGEVEEEVKDDDDDYSPKKSAETDRDAGGKSSKDKEEEEENEESGGDRDEEEDAGHPVTFEEVEQLRLSRETLEKWMDKPFFDKLIPGFFVRIGIGMDPVSRLNVYRVAQVESVETKTTSYNLGSKPTSKWLKLLIGDKGKDFKMETISNRPYTEKEYKHWMLQMENANRALPLSGEIPKKLQTLATAKDYRYTSDDIKNMLEQKKKAGVLPFKVATEKARLVLLRDAATDPKEKAKLVEQITKMEELGKERAVKRAPSSSVLNINQRNKEYNFITTLESKAEERSGNSDLDPFSRRRTLPRIVYASQHKDLDKPTENGTNDTPAITSNGNPTATTPLKTSTGALPVKTSEHDSIDIDIPLVTPSSTLPFPSRTQTTPTPTTPPFVPSEKEKTKPQTLPLSTQERCGAACSR